MQVRKQSVFRGVFRIVGFFSLVLVCIVAADQLINAGLRRIKTSSFGVSNRIMNGQINADILICGSSRAMTHYDPRIIQEATGRTAFNIGLNGSQTDMQIALLKSYLQHNEKPKLLIFNLDLFTFQVTHGGVYDPAQYFPYLREPYLYDALARVNSEVWKSRLLPLYGYAVEDLRFTWTLGFRGVFGWFPPEDRYQGFMPRHTLWTGEFDQFKEHNPEGVSFEIEPEGVLQMEEMLDLCQREQIEVLLVYSPEYKGMQDLERNRNEIFTHFSEISEKYDAVFWDYSESPICLQKDLFYNSQHLNAKGASMFSTDLAARIASDPCLGSVVPN